MNHKALSCFDLTTLKMGGAICLPILLVGHKLQASYGLLSSLIGIGVGNAVLCLFALVMAHLSFHRKENTPETAQTYFGDKGVIIFSSSLVLAKTCWFGIQLNLVIQTLLSYFQVSSMPIEILLNMSLGLLMIMLSSFGIRGLCLVTKAMLPLLVGTLVLSILLTKGGPESTGIAVENFSFDGISIVIAAAMTAVIDMPTYFSHARTLRDGCMAAIFLFLIALPLVEGVGIYLASQNPASTIFQTFVQDSSYAVWGLWITTFITIAGLTTNTANLFSAHVASKVLFAKESPRLGLVLIGGTGILFAITGILNYFTTVLQLVGINVASIGAIIMGQYLLKAQLKKMSPYIWMTGVIMGILSFFKILTLTQIPLVDAFLVSFGTTTLMVCFASLKLQTKSPITSIIEGAYDE